MEPAATPVDARLREAVHHLLEDGGPPYLQGLSRTAFIDALANELRFLGLVRQTDHETSARLHTWLEEQAEQWRRRYGPPQPAMPVLQLTLEASPFVALGRSATVGILTTPGNQALCLSAPAPATLQMSPPPAEDAAP